MPYSRIPVIPKHSPGTCRSVIVPDLKVHAFDQVPCKAEKARLPKIFNDV
jgi:hypothetical protein